MKQVPVVFLENTLVGVHGKGVPDWFLLANAQARAWGNEVYWLGNSEGADVQLGDLVTPLSAQLQSDYVHMSTNHYSFELFCIERWFYLAEFMRLEGVDVVLHLDSDVLLYCNASEVWNRWFQDHWFTLALGTSAATSYLTLSALEHFCKYVSEAYGIPTSPELMEANAIFDAMQAQQLPGGISDMYWWKTFRERVQLAVPVDTEGVGEMTHIRDGTTFDHNINVSDGYAMRGGMKDIRFTSQPEATWIAQGTRLEGGERLVREVKFNALHFQGGAKGKMRDYAMLERP